MNYALNNPGQASKNLSTFAALRAFAPILKGSGPALALSLVALLVNSGVTLVAPLLMGIAIDEHVAVGDFAGVVRYSVFIFGLFLAGLVASYVQIRVMGGVAQKMLFTLRNRIFSKLQELPVAFFNQNKAGDLISRINNDTDKLNVFFSQTLMHFVGNMIMIVGAGAFLLTINPRLGLASLAPAAALFLFTRAVSPWVRARNAISLKNVGGMSAEIQESLDNFKVIVAFNRRDYFRKRFAEVSAENYRSAVSAGIANNVFTPVYGLSANIAQLAVLSYGILLIASGQFTVGLLISYLSYVTRFYDPLRHIAALWAIFQTALAAWDRISAILTLTSDLQVMEGTGAGTSQGLLEFRGVHFRYPDGKEVLHGIDFVLEPGKTYALVGPTGGGKTTTASLMARLYDPTEGTVLLNGKDIRSYGHTERTNAIGFILQEPILFTGTVRDNLLYGNDDLAHLSAEELAQSLKDANLDRLLSRFDKGLDTPLSSAGEAVSLGQKQLIAFMRAVLRKPKLLILDEATANIDTVTEQLLEDILRKLPAETTKVIIAHRLNTIENADSIFFVNAGTVVEAGSMEHAVDMLLHGKRDS